MKIQDILSATQHRPWEMPKEGWKYYQEWNNVIFLHYQVDLCELERFVPNEIEIDKFENKPWVSVVAFTMENIRHKNLPTFSPISNFDEINIRTYVKSKGKTGVYFLSIEGGKSISCKVAKWISELPYRYSRIKRTKNQYSSYNSNFDERLSIEYVIGNKIKEKSELDNWLTERYALFQDTDKSINEFEIHHLEWPIVDVELNKLEINYKRFNKLINQEPNKIQYSKGVKVIAWKKTMNDKRDFNKQ